jgi:hypothetical protein
VIVTHGLTKAKDREGEDRECKAVSLELWVARPVSRMNNKLDISYVARWS